MAYISNKKAVRTTDEEQDLIPYPVRINRYLYLTNICSRRQADRFIEQGLISINGKTAVLGDKVEATDTVKLHKRLSNIHNTYRYFLLNKPVGVVSNNPQKGEKGAESFFNLNIPLYPIGRLDKDSYGLMLMTNDGRIVNKMLHPDFEHEKEYFVRVDKKINNLFMKHMKAGVSIEGYLTKPALVTMKSEKTIKIVLTEGKKHQIRRMCAALGYQVKELQRTRIGSLRLGNIPQGKHRELKEEEVHKLLSSIGIE